MGLCIIIINVGTFHRILTTPNENTWPSVVDLPDFKPCFPNWTNYYLENALNEKMPNKRKFDPLGYDLLQKMFIYDPAVRISAKVAVKHPYFDDLDRRKLPSYNYVQKF